MAFEKEPESNLTLFIVGLLEFVADFLDEHRRVLDQRLQPVVREITDSRARTRDELEGMNLMLGLPLKKNAWKTEWF